MIDSTGERIIVQTGGRAGPWVILAPDQVDGFKQRCREYDLPVPAVTDGASAGGTPDKHVDFGKGTDPADVQAALDSIDGYNLESD